jgi:predicted dinucleotide-binding enzyme
MKISVIGAGDMGGALARAFSKVHEVTVTGSKPHSRSALSVVRASRGRVKELPIARASESDLVVLAVPWKQVRAALTALGNLRGVTLLVVTLPWVEGKNRLEVGFDESGAEAIAARAKGADVVQAFNTLSATTIRQAWRYRPPATVFIAGGAPASKRRIAGLARDVGFDSVDAGDLSSARFTEPLAMLWGKLVLDVGYEEALAFRALRARRKAPRRRAAKGTRRA